MVKEFATLRLYKSHKKPKFPCIRLLAPNAESADAPNASRGRIVPERISAIFIQERSLVGVACMRSLAQSAHVFLFHHFNTTRLQGGGRPKNRAISRSHPMVSPIVCTSLALVGGRRPNELDRGQSLPANRICTLRNVPRARGPMLLCRTGQKHVRQTRESPTTTYAFHSALRTLANVFLGS